MTRQVDDYRARQDGSQAGIDIVRGIGEAFWDLSGTPRTTVILE
jgi:hypothetical protein